MASIAKNEDREDFHSICIKLEHLKCHGRTKSCKFCRDLGWGRRWMFQVPMAPRTVVYLDFSPALALGHTAARIHDVVRQNAIQKNLNKLSIGNYIENFHHQLSISSHLLEEKNESKDPRNYHYGHVSDKPEGDERCETVNNFGWIRFL